VILIFIFHFPIFNHQLLKIENWKLENEK